LEPETAAKKHCGKLHRHSKHFVGATRTVLIAAMPFEIERLAEAEIRRRFDCTLSG
jgi:hypothetical protein